MANFYIVTAIPVEEAHHICGHGYFFADRNQSEEEILRQAVEGFAAVNAAAEPMYPDTVVRLNTKREDQKVVGYSGYFLENATPEQAEEIRQRLGVVSVMETDWSPYEEEEVKD